MVIDIFLYQTSKVPLQPNKIYEMDYLDSLNYYVVEKGEKIPKTFSKMTQSFKIKNQYYNMEKIRQDYNIDKKSYFYICNISNDEITICIDSSNEGKPKEFIDIPISKIEKEYVYTQINLRDVVQLEKVYSQRKTIDSIDENLLAYCNEYCDDKDLLNEIIKKCELKPDILNKWENNSTFFVRC